MLNFLCNIKDGKEIVLRNKISQQRAFKIMETNEEHCYRFRFENGQLKVRKVGYEENRVAHVLGHILQHNLPDLYSLSNVSCIVGNKCKEADVSLRPKFRRTNGPYINQKPNMVCEFSTLVGEISRNKFRLMRSLKNWLGKYTTANIAIGIKLGKQIWFYMFIRGQREHVEINLNTVKRGDFVKIPLEKLYDGASKPMEDDYFILYLYNIIEELKYFLNK